MHKLCVTLSLWMLSFKMQSSKDRRTSPKLRELVSKLREHSYSDLTKSNAPFSLLERARKKRKTRHKPSVNEHVDTRFTIPVFNICERLFL